VPIYIGNTNQCRAKMRLLLPKTGMKKAHVEVKIFVASAHKLKIYGVRQR
jgi:hypothetical protein